MLVVENNTTFVNWGKSTEIAPLNYGGDVIVVFDPSKTNMAMLVGTPDGTILNRLEFSGNNRRRGPVMNTTAYCDEVRFFLRSYLSKTRLIMACTEQALLYDDQPQYYKSTMVMTEIRGNILNFFMEQFSIAVIEINNWAWKHGVLPVGYRQKMGKHSKRFFEDTMPGSPYCHYFEADMTDCVCMYWYIIAQKFANYTVYCNTIEPSITDYQWSILPDTGVSDALKPVQFNDRFSVEDNIAYYANRLFNPFVLTVPVERVELEHIYHKSQMFSAKDMWSKEVKVVASRK